MPSTPRKSDRTPILPSDHLERAFPLSDFLTQPVYSSPRQFPRAYLQFEYDDTADDEEDDENGFVGPAAGWPYDSNFPGHYSPFLIHKTVRGPGGRRINSPVPRIDTSVTSDLTDGATMVESGECPTKSAIYHHDQEVPTLIMSDSTHASASLASASVRHASRPHVRGLAPKPLRMAGRYELHTAPVYAGLGSREGYPVVDESGEEPDIWIETVVDCPEGSDLTTIQEHISTPELSETGTVVPTDVVLRDPRLRPGLGSRTTRGEVEMACLEDPDEAPRGRTMERRRMNRRGRWLVQG